MKLLYRYRKWRSKWRRAKRLLFISPAEAQFISIMDGWTIRLTWLRTLSGCQFVVLYDLGKTLKSHNIERELRAMSGIYLDFGSRINKKAIAIDGARWHMDLVAEAERDERLKAHGFKVLHIRANELKNSFRVRAKVMKFLAK